MRILIAAMLALTLVACGNVPGAPDHTYFRMSKAQTLPVSETPVFNTPIVVNLFAADGLYADRALVYALDPTGAELRQFHYQLWTDPPTRALQRRLLIELRDAAIAPLVTDKLASSQAALRISGSIFRFERVPSVGGGFIASVVLRLRVDRPDGTPQLDEIYHADVDAADHSLGATVIALSSAVDQIFVRFHTDLLESEAYEHAR
ncbi:MAG TPA: ABC-type transport auxiliary lipoprotein family protein [Dokdonella sp.]|uniref:ABC-type transport auxiliary lipoprotein family protein n=1 Tax=Dokdonella sp. TaxID=2291710 RepID=UPI002D7F0BF9|nr:ABC-type transport auxiliary lipoprotein family protein [Dokdonella sp.]HET9031367.1 ABC-type transport auxiliary lipoprotein family protein [Dokdonella sp.]